ncbi:hypothetical protein GCM10025855_18530 [Shewanella glacialipiscicola]|uniref:Oxidoreductase molybdopterin-binding domain-containing protein n=1 Tax=Shewanella glacialipiscicola TaxID=614069 RepID=A0ABQ6J2G8_9GAMM|nr:hypothetical protein GCM10025855_18530 [Shewanella glacialipiscicola]
MAKNSRFTPSILKKAQWHMQDNQVTPEAVFRSRRQIVKAMGLGAIGASVPGYVQAGLFDLFGEQPKSSFITTPLTFQTNKYYGDTDVLTPFDKVTQHNNFFEFGTDKQDPSNNAQGYKVDPWQLRIEGEVERPMTLDFNDLTTMFPLEERNYRLRCVEAWSMVVPWVGFPLAALLKKLA